MKKLIVALLLGMLPGAYAFPQPQQKQLQKQAAKGGPPVVNRRLIMEDLVVNFYVNQFQRQVEVSDETFGKITPFFRQFVQDRFEITTRRTRALNQLRQTVQNGSASEDDLRRAAHDFDVADHDFQANQEKFLSNVDPLLNPRQQARLRLFQVQADNRMRQMLDQLQQANRQNAQPN